jgi:hypothetical protein
MLGIVPVLCFAVLVITYAAICTERGTLTRWRASFLSAAVTWGIVVTAITESLSLFRLITFDWLLILWVGILVLSTAICFTVSTRERLTGLFQFPHHIPRFELWYLGGVASIAAVVGVVAYVTPPNNPDSLFYHMARVLHWIQNQAVAHYPTNILFQLFYPPWAEFAIMHLHVLNGGDHWSNLVQWFSMVGSIIGVSLIARELGADLTGQVLAMVVVATIPMGILQASSTQNDYVTAFWLVSLMYYVLRFKKQPAWTLALGAGVSLALALLTKVTAYIYAVPLLAWFTFAALRHFRWKVWQPLLLIGAIVLSMNLAHYARNIELWGNPLGFDQQNSHPNKRFGVFVTASNVIRNMSVHLGTRSLDINNTIREKIGSLHSAFGMDVNDPETTIWIFDQNWLSNSENRAGNPIHLMLIIVSLGLLFASNELRTSNLMPYAIVLTMAFLIFCSLIKWEVWHSRLHLPLFVLWSPFVSSSLIRKEKYSFVFLITIILIIASTLYVSRYSIPLMVGVLVLCLMFNSQPWLKVNRCVSFLVATFLICGSTWYVLDNDSRPLIGSSDRRSILKANRTDQFFIYHPWRNLREVYSNASNLINSQKCSEIGLVTGIFGREYLFWVLLEEVSHARIRVEHLNVANLSAIKSTAAPFVDFCPCAIIIVDTDYYTAPNLDGAYVKAWSSGPVRVGHGSENVSVFTKREAL